MTAAPGATVFTSSWAVSGFMQISTPMSRRRAMKPSLEARIVNHVGRPWMLEGKRFLPETGIPIWKIDRIRIVFEDWLPDPLAVATWIEKSLMTGGRREASARFSSRTAVDMLLLAAGLLAARRSRALRAHDDTKRRSHVTLWRTRG